MIKIMNAIDCMEKELKHAYKFLDYALEAKHADMHELYEIYFKIAENEAANAELIHTVVIRMVDKASMGENQPPQGMKDIWNWRHKEYVEEYSQFKAKVDALKRLS